MVHLWLKQLIQTLQYNKYFIRISAQGVTTFISPAWGERVSDKH